MLFEMTKNKIAPHHMMRVLYLFGTAPDQQCPKLLSSAVVPFGRCSDDRGDLTKTLLITTATSIFGKKITFVYRKDGVRFFREHKAANIQL